MDPVATTPENRECTSMIILSASIFGGLYGLLLIIVIYMCVKYSKEKPKEWENVNAFVRNLEQQRERQSNNQEAQNNRLSVHRVSKVISSQELSNPSVHLRNSNTEEAKNPLLSKDEKHKQARAASIRKSDSELDNNFDDIMKATECERLGTNIL